jgi:neutral trehalase
MLSQKSSAKIATEYPEVRILVKSSFQQSSELMKTISKILRFLLVKKTYKRVKNVQEASTFLGCPVNRLFRVITDFKQLGFDKRGNVPIKLSRTQPHLVHQFSLADTLRRMS